MRWRERALSALLRPARRAAEVRARLGRRARRTAVEEVDGVPIVVLPDVFNPVMEGTSPLVARALRRAVGARPADAPPLAVLDLGTGCGLAAVFAALRGAEVVAVDLNPEAVRNARLNAQLHHVEHRVDVRQGDLYGPLEGRRFDLVAFDPPRHQGQPTTFFDLAWESEDVLDRFVAGLPGALNEGGAALIGVSSDTATARLPELLTKAGFTLETVHERRRLGAVERVLRASV